MSASALGGDRASSNSRTAAHAVFGLLILAYAVAFSTTLVRLAGVWAGDGTFQYGFLIPPISLFLIWSRRRELVGVPFKPDAVGAALVGAASLLWMLGSLVGVQLVQQFAVIALLPSLVWAVYGRAVVRALLFPLVYLFFAFPWPVESLTLILQHITAEFAVRVLQLTGFVVYLNGVLIETPVAVWHVADACSGIKFFLAMVALGLLYAHLFFRSAKRRIIFVLLAFFVPIIANGFRVYFTVVIGEVFGVQYATGTDHLVFGWQFFGTVLLLFFLAGWPWHELPPDSQSAASVGRSFAPVSGGPVRLVPVFAALLLIGPLLTWMFATAGSVSAVPAGPADSIGPWRTMVNPEDLLGARFNGADQKFMVGYSDGIHRVNFVSADYSGLPRHGHKLFMVGNRWYDPAEWKKVASSNAKPSAWHGARNVLHQVVLANGGQRRLVWYWYEVSGQRAAGTLQVKLLQLGDVLRLRPVTTRIIVLSTPVRSDRHVAVTVLNGFLRALQAAKTAESAHGKAQ